MLVIGHVIVNQKKTSIWVVENILKMLRIFMEEKILKMKLTPFDPKYDDTNKIFIDYTKKELGFFNLP